ncbi:MAG: SEL1-like repeat protein, partial [Longimicrobiales bacterium]|nr:SEL1-like repeat protein [Longimicrobiales bacterium]
GKLIFGVLYGLGVFGLFSLLGALGVPTFYDKLLCVPLLNLSVQRIDGAVRAIQETDLWERFQPDLASTRANLVHMGLWTLFFGSMAVLGRTDATHPGDRVPFWIQACEEGRRNACQRLIQIEYTYCADNSGWACNELGRHYRTGEVVAENEELARTYFGRACELRFQPGCLNLLETDSAVAAAPRPLDLRLLLREGGRNLLEASERELYDRACAHGWSFACQELATSP